MFPLRLSRPFIKLVLKREVRFHDLAFYDNEMYEHIRQVVEMASSESTADQIEDLALDFTLKLPEIEGGAEIKLKPENEAVTKHNIYEYAEAYITHRIVKPYEKAASYIREGILQVFSPNVMKDSRDYTIDSRGAFHKRCMHNSNSTGPGKHVPNPVGENLLSQFSAESWSLMLNGTSFVDVKVLRKVTEFTDEITGDILGTRTSSRDTARETQKQDLKYKSEFWEVVESFSQAELQNLLYFWTGAPLLPFSIENWEPKTQVTLRPKETDDRKALLPTANTCINRLYLPRYNNKEVLKAKLRLAIQVKSFGFV